MKKTKSINCLRACFVLVVILLTMMPPYISAEAKKAISERGLWIDSVLTATGENRNWVYDDVAFSRNSGFFREPFYLVLETGLSNGVIRYTLDGSEPTADSPQYTAPISITNRSNTPGTLAALVPNHSHNAPLSQGTVVRVRVFDENDNPVTGVFTRTYFVGLYDSYVGFPVISLATDQDNLFGSTGIYSNHQRRGADWERPAHFEIIEPDGSGFSADVGIRIHGGDSRRYPQKAFRVYARRRYDPQNQTLRYDLFAGNATDIHGNPVTEFRRFILRAHGQGQLQHQADLMRDPLMQNLAHGLNMGRQGNRPAIVFLNGEFWGLYTITERIDRHFVSSNFLIEDAGNIGILNFTDQPSPEQVRDAPDCPYVQADYASYLEMMSWFESIGEVMTDEEFEKAQTFLDIDNFIDYWAFNIGISNVDWPNNNLRMWRYRTDSFPECTDVSTFTDGRWRYVLQDLDHTFGTTFGASRHERIIARIMAAERSLNMPTLKFRTLLRNDTFRCRFITRTMDIMNTHLHADAVISAIYAYEANIESVVPEHAARWNSNLNDPVGHWRENVSRLREFAASRQSDFYSPLNLPRQLNDFFNLGGLLQVDINVIGDNNINHVKINGINIIETASFDDGYSWSGSYFAGNTITVTVVSDSTAIFEINGDLHDATDGSATFTLEGDTAIEIHFDPPQVLPQKPPAVSPPPSAIISQIYARGGFGTNYGVVSSVFAVQIQSPDDNTPANSTAAIWLAGFVFLFIFVVGIGYRHNKRQTSN